MARRLRVLLDDPVAGSGGRVGVDAERADVEAAANRAPFQTVLDGNPVELFERGDRV